MIEVMLWLLLTTSDGSYNRGTTTVVERFVDKEQCMHVLRNIPYKSAQESACVQAKVAVLK